MEYPEQPSRRPSSSICAPPMDGQAAELLPSRDHVRPRSAGDSRPLTVGTYTLVTCENGPSVRFRSAVLRPPEPKERRKQRSRGMPTVPIGLGLDRRSEDRGACDGVHHHQMEPQAGRDASVTRVGVRRRGIGRGGEPRPPRCLSRLSASTRRGAGSTAAYPVQRHARPRQGMRPARRVSSSLTRRAGRGRRRRSDRWGGLPYPNANRALSALAVQG
jgi:hypothetical protein